jgi:hypothetical protein
MRAPSGDRGKRPSAIQAAAVKIRSRTQTILGSALGKK